MSIFKGTFPPGIKKQLEVRQNAFLKRDSKSVQYLNSRTAWIRMTSSVGVKGDNGKSANSNVLLGGALSNNALRQGVGTSGTEAYSTQTPEGNKYRLGTRPMPGITGIDVKTKGGYGSLREVTVKFICWDIKQLEELELLYMRLGYTVLIEWGWIPYLDNNGNLQSIPSPISDLLISTPPSKESILKKIYQQSSVDGNYDAAYGRVNKYEWSARPDGGYDCTATIITMGEIAQSLKINYIASDTDVATKGMFGKLDDSYFKKNSPLNISYNRSKLAGMIDEIWRTAVKEGIENKKSKSLSLGNVNCDLFRFDVSVSDQNVTAKETFVEEDTQIYITLESFINLLNKYIILLDDKSKTPLVEVSVKEGAHNGGKEGDMLLCRANILQLSTNPTVCQIKNMKYTDPAQLGFLATTWTDYTTMVDIMNGLEKEYFKGNFGIIGNIYVNLGYLYSLIINDELSSQDSKEKKEILLYDYLKDVLLAVNTAIGTVANFDIIIDPVDSVARIVDLGYIEEDRAKAYTNAATVEIHNTKSTVRSYKFESKIFPDQSALVAMGAQVKGGALSSNVSTLLDFNKGLKDRIIPTKENPPVLNTTSDDTKLQNLKTNLDIILDYINKIDPDWYLLEFVGDFSASNAAEYSNALKDAINIYLSLIADDNKNRDIIPTKLSIEMDGIGGIAIGNLFKIPEELIPKGYKGINVGTKIAYVVTEISHTVQDNNWTTKIGAQYVVMNTILSGLDASKFIGAIARALEKVAEGKLIGVKEVQASAETANNAVANARAAGATGTTGTTGTEGDNPNLIPATGGKYSIDPPYGNIVKSAKANIGFSTRNIPNTENGNLGCGAAASVMFLRATGYPLVPPSELNLSTISIWDYVVSHPKIWVKRPTTHDGQPGDLIITKSRLTPGKKISGHVGFIIDTKTRGSFNVISNSSRPAKIEQNFTIDSWMRSMAPKNPSETGAFQYIGPFVTSTSNNNLTPPPPPSTSAVDAIFIGGCEPGQCNGGPFVSLAEQTEVFKQGYGKNKTVKSFHFYDSNTSITNYIKQNLNAIVVMYSAGCNKATVVASIPKINKNRIYMIEPYAKGGNSRVAGAVGLGVPARNVFVGTYPGVGLGVVDNATPSNSTSHGNAPKDVGARLK